MNNFKKGQIFEESYPPDAARFCMENNLALEIISNQGQPLKIQIQQQPEILPEIEDYDEIMEQYLITTRCQRGYTTRQPSEYLNSTVERWKQDAIDWIKFRDECMLYGLQIQNKYANGQQVISLEQFQQNLPKIKWTYE